MPKKAVYNIGIDARFFTSRATGIGRHTFELVKHLSDIDKKNQYTLFLSAENAANFKIDSPRFSVEISDATHYSWQEQTQFLKQISDHHFDLMVFPHFNVPIFYNRPFVVTIHDLTLHFFAGKKNSFLRKIAYKYVIKNAVEKARHIFSVSANTKKDIVKHLGQDPDKITIAHCGVSDIFTRDHLSVSDHDDDYKNRKEVFTTKLPRKYFLHHGVCRAHKNIPRLIKAFEYFQKKDPKHEFSLVLSGPTEDLFDVKDLIDKNPRIKHIGMVDEDLLPELFYHAHAYVFPSLYEGFGLPPIEAMMCSLPTAVSYTSSIPEVCGDASLYFDPYNVHDIADKMYKITHDKKIRERCIEKGKIQAKKFRWDAMAQTMYQTYLQILSKK